MVAIVLYYRNLFDILIDFVENYVWLTLLCLGLRMHEGQNRVPCRKYIEED